MDAHAAGWTCNMPEYQYIQKGLEFAQSYVFNPHKWMLTNFHCSCLFIKNQII